MSVATAERDVRFPTEPGNPGSASGKLHGRSWIRRNAQALILCFVSVLYLALSFWVLRAGLSHTGTLTYPLDDTYIGMAMAKNFALHGVWGISRTRFASATSSPGFILLLAAAYRLTQPTVWWPLALSLGFGLLALAMAQRLLSGVTLATQFLALCAILYLTPLHILGVLGMEHTLHLALILLFLDLAGRSLADRRSPDWTLLLLAGLLVAVRYESLFIVGVACLLFLLQRQMRAAVKLGIAAAAPATIYGTLSMLYGSYWLPNSISLKGLSGRAAVHSPTAIAVHFADCLARAPHMGAILGATGAAFFLPGVRADRRTRSLLAMVFGATLLHLAFADVDWVFRYEGYLVGAAIAVIACVIPRINFSRDLRPAAALVLFCIVGGRLLLQRTGRADGSLPYRSFAVYCQQVQMARFLARFEPGVAVAANDVGAINYYADIDCLDLVGLGDSDIFWLKRQGLYSTDALARLAARRHVQIAMVYNAWFSGSALNFFSGPSLPASWIPVEHWDTPYEEYLGGPTVSFYATDPVDAEQLKRSLDEFRPSLPAEVKVFDR